MTKIALLTFAFTMFFVNPALAEEASNPYMDCATMKPTAEKVSSAKAAFVLGKTAYEEGRFDDSLFFFKEAYRHDCSVEMLVHHIGMIYESQKKYEEALVAYQAYIERSKDRKDALVVETVGKISVLQGFLSAKNPPNDQTSTGDPSPVPSKPVKAKTRLSDIKLDEAPTEPKTSSKWAPITTTVVGGIATVVGLGVYLDGVFERRRIEDQCSNYTCQDADLTKQGNSARERVKIGSIVAISGIAVTAAGVTWLVLGSQEHPEKPVASIQSWVSPSGGGIAYRSTF